MTTASSRKRVRVYYAGGMQLPAQITSQDIHAKLSEYLVLQMVAETDLVVFEESVSIQASPRSAIQLVQRIAQDITEHFSEYDGFVIIHEQTTAPFTGSLLEFMFDQLGKPIVLAGNALSNNTSEAMLYENMSLRANLMTALQMAVLNCRGVLLAYGSHIVRAVRAINQRDASLGFTAYQESPVGEVTFGAEVTPGQVPRDNIVCESSLAVSHKVLTMDMHPGTEISPELGQQYDAVIIRGNDQPVVSIEHFPGNVPIIIDAQQQGTIEQENVVNVHTLLLPTLISKTMVAAGRYTTPSDVVEFVATHTHNESVEL